MPRQPKPHQAKNKRATANLRGSRKKKAAPLGAAVIATLNHITGHTLQEPVFDGMG